MHVCVQLYLQSTEVSSVLWHCWLAAGRASGL